MNRLHWHWMQILCMDIMNTGSHFLFYWTFRAQWKLSFARPVDLRTQKIQSVCKLHKYMYTLMNDSENPESNLTRNFEFIFTSSCVFTCRFFYINHNSYYLIWSVRCSSIIIIVSCLGPSLIRLLFVICMYSIFWINVMILFHFIKVNKRQVILYYHGIITEKSISAWRVELITDTFNDEKRSMIQTIPLRETLRTDTHTHTQTHLLLTCNSL